MEFLMTSTQQRTRRSALGFTLIELMITVAVVAILAAIAYPAYLSQVMTSRRAVASACLLETAQWMERNYTTTLNYTQSPAISASTLSDGDDLNAITPCPSDARVFYDITIKDVDSNAYTLSAKPKAGTNQANDTCGELTIDQAGTKTAEDTTDKCWKR
jgi:type IV pilus assembly protein PilE